MREDPHRTAHDVSVALRDEKDGGNGLVEDRLATDARVSARDTDPAFQSGLDSRRSLPSAFPPAADRESSWRLLREAVGSWGPIGDIRGKGWRGGLASVGRRAIPATAWLPIYDWRRLLRQDLVAGLTVGTMLLPQGMSYALVAGLPPVHGLYAAFVPLLIYSFLGTSRQLAVGPVALMSLLTATSVGELAAEGTADYLTLALTLALLVGVVMLTMGLLGMGFLVNFLSHSVVGGFTSGAALLIAVGQARRRRLSVPEPARAGAACGDPTAPPPPDPPRSPT